MRVKHSNRNISIHFLPIILQKSTTRKKKYIPEENRRKYVNRPIKKEFRKND